MYVDFVPCHFDECLYELLRVSWWSVVGSLIYMGLLPIESYLLKKGVCYHLLLLVALLSASLSTLSQPDTKHYIE